MIYELHDVKHRTAEKENVSPYDLIIAVGTDKDEWARRELRRLGAFDHDASEGLVIAHYLYRLRDQSDAPPQKSRKRANPSLASRQEPQTPMQTFQESKHLAHAKMLDERQLDNRQLDNRQMERTQTPGVRAIR